MDVTGSKAGRTKVVASALFAALSVPAGLVMLSGATGPSDDLAVSLRSVEQTWAERSAAGLRLTGADKTAIPSLGDGDAVAWSVPSIGRVAVGHGLSLAARGAPRNDLVVTDIGIVDDGNVSLAHGRGQPRSLVVTLRARSGMDAGEPPIRLIVSGTPVLGPAAPAIGVDKAL